MAAGDVYAIKLPSTNTAWIQVMDETNIGRPTPVSSTGSTGVAILT